jgi:tight adherence protein C
MLLLVIGLFVFLSLALFALGAATLAPASAIGARLRSLGAGRVAEPRKMRVEERFEQQVLDPLSRAVPRSPSEVSRTRHSLMMAGYRQVSHLTFYYGMRVLLPLLAIALLITSRWGISSPALLISVPLFLYLLPRFVMKRLIKHRQREIRLALPDAMDLAVICVEAGLSLDHALQRVGQDLRHVHPALGDEFSLVTLEMRAGKPRAEALRNLAARTGVDDMRSLVAVLVQTDRFGTSIAQALRVHSDALRTERRQRAEEAAAKTTIKMVPVLVFFVFPPMFFVTVGPAAIKLVRELLPIVQK